MIQQRCLDHSPGGVRGRIAAGGGGVRVELVAPINLHRTPLNVLLWILRKSLRVLCLVFEVNERNASKALTRKYYLVLLGNSV